ncbi:hypothetical protein BaRGS_00028449 [Batillaria attramentaria]|uniref:Uncharacterized protein n=1 Tax=Batillaria attramentaria TaxID=370345 RepID=A0ABD0JZW1_9CAEN
MKGLGLRMNVVAAVGHPDLRRPRGQSLIDSGKTGSGLKTDIASQAYQACCQYHSAIISYLRHSIIYTEWLKQTSSVRTKSQRFNV